MQKEPRVRIPTVIILVLSASLAASSLPVLPATAQQQELPGEEEPGFDDGLFEEDAESQRYYRCLDEMNHDPRRARTRGLGWYEETGSPRAAHCAASAAIAAGDVTTGAGELEELGRTHEGISGRDQARLLFLAGRAWLMAGDADAAASAYGDALVIAPDEPELRLDRAVALMNAGRFDEALEDLDHILTNQPDQPEALYYQAVSLRFLDRPEEAREAADRLLAAEPDDPDARLERALSSLALERDGDAREDLDHVIDSHPDSQAARTAEEILSEIDR